MTSAAEASRRASCEEAPAASASDRTYWRVVLTAWLALAVCMGGLAVASTVLDPDRLEAGAYAFVPSCPTKNLTGQDCPTCGMSRAFAAIGHGRISDAIRYHRVSPLAFSFVCAAALLGAVQSARTLRDSRRASARRNA